jgi:CheY-like chemotaxis protein
MVYGIVRQSGGRIDVASEVGDGTTFTLYFPAADATTQPLDRTPAQPGGKGVPACLLVVEYQPEVRDLAVSALRRAGHEVFEASDGDEAFARFGERATDVELLLTDVVMPGMNGRELAEQLRARNADLLVIFMSGYTDEILDQQSLVGPGSEFLAKPFTPGALVRQVDRLLLATGNRGAGRRGSRLTRLPALRHQARPLRRVGVLLERRGLAVVEAIHVAERGVELRAAGLDRPAIPSKHHHMVPAVHERRGHRGERVDRRHQTCEDAVADCLRADVGIAVRQRAAFGLVPRDGRIHGSEQYRGIVPAERGVGRLDGLERSHGRSFDWRRCTDMGFATPRALCAGR